MMLKPEELRWVGLGASGWSRATATLGEGDTAWNPASAEDAINGPCSITYQRRPDGSVDALIATDAADEGQIRSTRYPSHRKLGPGGAG